MWKKRGIYIKLLINDKEVEEQKTERNFENTPLRSADDINIQN